MDASLVMFCWVTEHLGSTERAASSFACLAGALFPLLGSLLEDGPLTCFFLLDFSSESRSVLESVPVSFEDCVRAQRGTTIAACIHCSCQLR